jgi:hypothetical protein
MKAINRVVNFDFPFSNYVKQNTSLMLKFALISPFKESIKEYRDNYYSSASEFYIVYRFTYRTVLGTFVIGLSFFIKSFTVPHSRSDRFSL